MIKAVREGLNLEARAGEFFGLERHEKERLLEAIREVRSESAGIFLNLLLAGEEDKQLRKAIKRDLFLLKTSGIRVEERTPEGEPVLRKFEEPRLHQGFLTNYDADGARIVIAALELKKNLCVLFHGITHSLRGLDELRVTPVKRADLAGLIKGYRENPDRPMVVVDISFSYASYLLDEASRISGRSMEEMKQLRQYVSQAKDPIATPDDLRGLPVPANTIPISLEEILESRILTVALPDRETLERYKKEYLEVGGSTIVLPPYMAEQKKAEYIDKLVAGAEFGPHRRAVARIFEDYAYISYQLGDFAAYLGLLKALDEDKLTEEALRRLLKQALQREEEPREQHPGLIVSPYGKIRS